MALAILGGIAIVLIILANSGGDSNRTFVPPVSKALDEKNGFKDFKFGMPLEEARQVVPPSTVTDQPGANATVFNYRATSVNRIGDFSTDNISLRFFNGNLYRIAIRFSSFPNKIFEACKINYGAPWDDDGWTRGDQKLRARTWRGEKVAAAILSPPNQAWDSLVIYDIEANQKAQEYAAKEPERAATDFGPSGFKSLVFGMKLQSLTVEFDVLEEDRFAAVKKVVFRKGDWRTVGFYPLITVSAEFFNDKLYRIDLGLEENRKEMFEAFQHRFGPLQDNDTWTRGSMKLKAKSAINGKVFATILTPSTSYGSSDSWDAIVLLDTDLRREVEQFKKDAPKRAAKDF